MNEKLYEFPNRKFNENKMITRVKVLPNKNIIQNIPWIKEKASLLFFLIYQDMKKNKLILILIIKMKSFLYFNVLINYQKIKLNLKKILEYLHFIVLKNKDFMKNFTQKKNIKNLKQIRYMDSKVWKWII